MLIKTILFIFQSDEGTSEIDPFNFAKSFGNTLLIIFLVLIIWYVVAIFLAIWVYKDAQKRIHNENIWVIIVLISGIIGFLIYILHRDEEIIHEEEVDAEEIKDVDDIL